MRRAARLISAFDTCPGCANDKSRPSFEKDGHRFRRCRSCHTLFLDRLPDPEVTGSLYTGERYFANPQYDAGEYHGYKDYLADREAIEEKFTLVLEQIERYVESGELLDVGSGPGFLLGVARSRGWRPHGVELNPWAAGYGREQIGVDVRTGTLEEARFGDGEFDAVTMMDLIEHLINPERSVAEAARITRTGGVLALLTPNAGSWTSRLLRGRWPEVERAPEHIVLFSLAGLAAMLRRQGWEPLGWHNIGKRSSVRTLIADVSPVHPPTARVLQRLTAGRKLAERRLRLNPRAKVLLYARRLGRSASHAGHGEPEATHPPVRLSMLRPT